MPAPQNLEQLLGLIRKSNLVDPQHLEQYLNQIGVSPSSSLDIKEFTQLLIRAGMLTHFQSEQLLLGKWRGFAIGKYRVLERLGSGGMGNVYLCEHVQMCHKVAIKVLPTAKNNDPAALGRFYREARAAGVLDHPNLVRAFDIDQDGELHFLVMEYVDGVNLQQLVGRRREPLAIPRACYYIYQAALGLQHAHNAGLVHRDIKPANILLDRQGVIRVLDMGLARFFNDNQDLLTIKYDDKNVLGTADYVSPEQAIDSHGVDIRSDLYSLGATFYFLLTGQPLFPEGKVAQKLIWHQTRQPALVNQLRPEVPQELAVIVHKMLAKDRRDRYQTPAEVIDALEPWVQVPIAPPSEEELPRLSLAARVTAAPEVDVGARLSGRSSGIDLHRMPMPSSHRRIAEHSPVGARGGESPTLMTVTPPRMPRPGRPDELTPPSLGGENSTVRAVPPGTRHGQLTATRLIEESLAPDPTNSPTQSPASAADPTPEWRRRTGFYVALSLVFGLSAGIVVRGWFQSRTQGPSSAPRVLVVSHSGEQEHFATVLQALEQARPGDQIVIREESWEETLHLHNGLGRGVLISGLAPSGRTVVWRGARADNDRAPILRVDQTAGVKVKGFLFDGEDRREHLLEINGASPGLTLEDLHLKAYRHSGVRMSGVAGQPLAPVALQRIRTTTSRGVECAILLQNQGSDPCQQVRITQCRLEGPAQAGIAIQGSLLEGDFQQNRIYNMVDGLRIGKTPPAPLLRLNVIANTFCEIQGSALHLEATPQRDGSQICVNRNLFTRTALLAQLDDFHPQPERTRAQWIWTHHPSTEGFETAYFRKSFRPGGAPEHAQLNIVGDDSFIVWVNGQPVGQGELRPGASRVSCYDIGKYLTSEVNVLAIQATNRSGPGGLLVDLTTRLQGSPEPLHLVSDSSWKVTTQAPPGWQKPLFNDATWSTAQRISAEPRAPLIWDCRVLEHFPKGVSSLFPVPSGNVRDETSQERFPCLEAVPLRFDLNMDQSDEDRFLRYPADSPLLQHGSPGVAPLR